MKTIPIAAVSAALIFVASEVSLIPFGGHSPLAQKFLSSGGARFIQALPLRPLQSATPTATDQNPTGLVAHPGNSITAAIASSANPFISIAGQPQQMLMPFIGFGYAVSKYPAHLDYFGFRNHLGDSVYFRDDRPVIVMTGNSELAGFNHPVDIAELLQKELNSRGFKFDVLNLGMGSYSLAAELGAYIHYGDQVCPILVISHSGGVEYQYGMVVPSNFRKLGLAYHPPLEEWAYRLYRLRGYDGPPIWRQRDPDARLEETVESTIKLIHQFRSIVERDRRSHFLFGAQKIGETHSMFPFWTMKTRDEFMSKLRNGLDGSGTDFIWFDDDDRVVLDDPIHSTPAAAEHIAKRYAEWIQSNISLLSTRRCPRRAMGDRK